MQVEPTARWSTNASNKAVFASVARTLRRGISGRWTHRSRRNRNTHSTAATSEPCRWGPRKCRSIFRKIRGLHANDQSRKLEVRPGNGPSSKPSSVPVLPDRKRIREGKSAPTYKPRRRRRRPRRSSIDGQTRRRADRNPATCSCSKASPGVHPPATRVERFLLVSRVEKGEVRRHEKANPFDVITAPWSLSRPRVERKFSPPLMLAAIRHEIAFRMRTTSEGAASVDLVRCDHHRRRDRDRRKATGQKAARRPAIGRWFDRVGQRAVKSNPSPLLYLANR